MVDINAAINQLNEPQKKACLQIEGPLLVLAGAGTGKTKVIITRLAYMISRGISASSIAAMTFTNKAAREMKDRLSLLTSREHTKNLTLGTFHSFCLKFLRKHADTLGYAHGFSLASTSDQLDILAQAIKDEKTLAALNLSSLHSLISKAKNELFHPEKDKFVSGLTLQALSFDDFLLAYNLYERQLRLNRMMDFDDCIQKTAHLLESRLDILNTLKEQYRYFLVDEFQDTNRAQLRILELLASEHKNICVVGDDDQSIYSWRGAVSEIMEDFERIFSGSITVKLEQNYRCTNVILDAANAVIKNNSRRKDKKLWSSSPTTDMIRFDASIDEPSEASDVCLRIMSLLGEGFNPSDVAILYRANNLSRGLELVLRELRIPYEIFGGSSFFERKEVKDFLSYARLSVLLDDRLAFWRVINTPHRGFGIKTLEKIEQLCSTHKKSPFFVLKNLRDELHLTAPQKHQAAQFVQMIDDFSQMPLTTPEEFLAFGNQVIKKTLLAKEIRDTTKDPASIERKLEALDSLPGWLSRCASDLVSESGCLEASELLDRLTLGERDVSEDSNQKKRNAVSLMTVHASKGLEFPAVFVVGLEEELFPHKNSLSSPDGLQEERRLFYVAITRAKRRLYLSCALERGVGGFKSARTPSRFLQETALSFEAIQNNLKSNLQEKQQNTLSKFQSLRQTLSNPTRQ